jgi:DNA-directed RNA polymerase specialized sigma24 family protein
MRTDFVHAVEQFRDGRTTYAEFASSTREKWVAMARYLMRHWKSPDWVEVEDVVQDLLLGAWQGVWVYEPARGRRDLAGHVEYTAVDKAKKRLHKLRGARLHGNADANPSHIDIPFSTLSKEGDGEQWAMNQSIIPASQEHEVADAMTLERLKRDCQSFEEILMVEALYLTEDLIASVQMVYGDERARDILQLQDEAHAARVLVRAAHAVADRLEKAA